MKKISRSFFLALLIFSIFSSLSFADDTFSAVCKNISAHKVTKGDFSQVKTISLLNRSISSSGNFIISADDGIFWNTLKPIPSKMSVCKDKIIQISAGGRKNILKMGNNAAFEEFSGVLSSVFSGSYDILEGNFQIGFSGTVEKWNVSLIPNSETVKKFITKIEMTGGKSIDTVLLSEASGDSIKYVFSNQTFTDNLSTDEKSLFN